VVGRQWYDPYGGLRGPVTALPTDYGFTGERRHAATGWVQLGVRWLDPETGRFTSADTLVPETYNPQALNRYSYVVNRPLNFTDPTGHCFGPLAKVCAHVALALVVDLVVKDIAEDGRFDTPSHIRTTVTTGGSMAAGNPFNGYRDSQLPSTLTTSSPDLTAWLEKTMKANAAGGIAQTLRDANAGSWEDKAAAYLGWAAMVKGGAPWDYKVELNAATVRTVVLSGREFRMDVVANIHFGYVGRASGFSAEELMFGAGVAQVLDGTSDWDYWRSYFDDPQDQFAIWLGIWLFEHSDMTLEDAIDLYGDHLSPP
jgi:RHS repeat-associated protein